MASQCINDDAFGPAVRGCRGDFDFTVKFELLFMALIPSSVFIALSLTRTVCLFPRSKIARGAWFQLLKLAIISVYIALQISFLAVMSIMRDSSYNGLPTASAVLGFIEAISMIPLSYQEHSKTPRPSMLLSSYLLLTTLFDIVRVRTLWLTVSLVKGPLVARLFTSALAVKVLILFLEARQKTRWLSWEPTVHSPEETSGLYNLGVYFWLNKLFLRGYKSILNIDDLYALDSSMTTELMAARLSEPISQGKLGGKKHALAKVLARVLAVPLLLMPVAPRIALTGFNFCQPFFINALLDYLEGSSSPNIGYGLIGASALIYAGIAISTAFYQYYTHRGLCMVRGALASVIYRKTTVSRSSTAGDAEAVTLMSTDIERIMLGFRQMHEFWANIIEVALGCWLLQRQLGLAFLAPIGVIAVCTGLITIVGTLTGSRQRAWMETIQRRVGLTAEVLPNMKHLHIAGITGPVTDFIQGLRLEEIKTGSAFRMLTVVSAVISHAPSAISPTLAYAVTSADLDVSTIYTSLSYILLATAPLGGLFQNIPQILTGFTCLNRIQKYLEAEEQADTTAVTKTEKGAIDLDGHHHAEPSELNEKASRNLDLDNTPMPQKSAASASAVQIIDGSFGWIPEEYTLKNIDVCIPCAQLSMVVGPVASGKSTLCKALLNEVPFYTGRVNRPARQDIGYCEQAPFLSNATVQENIVSHNQFDPDKYREVIEATMLSIDMAQLPNGDTTRIGSGGVILSGGQKQRVALARALYAPSQLLIFDDILSGLDDDTAMEIFRRVFGLNGLIRRRNTTAVLCTHSVRHLPSADHIIALMDGTVVEEGTFEDLKDNQNYIQSLNVQEGDSSSNLSADTSITEAPGEPSTCLVGGPQEIVEALDERSRQTGDWAVYKHYFSRIQPFSIVVFILLSIIYAVSRNMPTIWMNYWAADSFHRSTGFYLGIYALFSVTQLMALGGIAGIVLITFIASSGAELHADTLATVVRAPLRFFTTTDLGVITNLFSQDMTLIDTELPLALTNFTAVTIDTMGMAAVLAVASPYVALSYPVLFLVLYTVQKFYLRTSRQMRLLDLEAKSPLYAHFLDTIRGLATIRAFNWTSFEIDRNNGLIDTSQQPAYLLVMIQQWLALTMQLMVTGIAVLVTALATQLQASSGFTGASMVTLMGFGTSVTTIIQNYTLLETSLGAVSRLKTFSEKMPLEDSSDQVDDLPREWPHKGEVSIDNLSASYSHSAAEPLDTVSDVNAVLKHVTLHIRSGEKVAICGRSGSGKSSLILLLLRLLDPLPSAGSGIIIDGVPLRRIQRSAVRSHIIAVPQEAIFLSSGSTLQANLDPTGFATESDCLAVLEAVQMASFAASKGGLPGTINAGDLSAGQKQLLSLARAILRKRIKSRQSQGKDGGILLLDEVSSSVDQSTDRLMQAIVREEFASYTVIMVSHRLDVVRDFCDRVVVMDKGSVVETGPPKKLIERDGSRFGELWRITHSDR